MKQKVAKVLPLLLAAGLQVMPLVRQALPVLAQGGSSPAWAIILKLGLGTVALMGSYHTVSGATTFTPAPNSTISATVGVPLSTNITVAGTEAAPHTWAIVGQACPATGVGSTFAPGITLPNPSSFSSRVALNGTPTTAGTFTNTIRVWEDAGCGNNSATAFYTLVVAPGANQSPAITLAPTNRMITVGSDTSFIAAASGNPAPGFFWQRNGLGIPNATNSTFTLTNTPLALALTYTVYATNSLGAASNSCLLSVIQPPVNQTNLVGDTATLSAIGNSPLPLTYQWRYSNTLNVPGATNASLVFSNAVLTNTDTYTLIVSNATGAASYSATLTVVSPPVFITGLADVTTNVGGSATFTRSATGTSPFNYSWFLKGVFIKSGLIGSLTLTNLQVTDSGTVMEVASNAFGFATNTATLTIIGPTTLPVITNQPQSLIVPQGNPAGFTVVAGGGSLNYQWFQNASNAVGTNLSTLSLANAQPPQSGLYTVVITNTSGSVTSSPAQLLVVPPPAASNAPALTLPPPNPGQFALSFPVEPGFHYLLLGSTDLNSGWFTLADLPPGFSNTQFNFTDGTTNLLRFYRTTVTNQ